MLLQDACAWVNRQLLHLQPLIRNDPTLQALVASAVTEFKVDSGIPVAAVAEKEQEAEKDQEAEEEAKHTHTHTHSAFCVLFVTHTHTHTRPQQKPNEAEKEQHVRGPKEVEQLPCSA
jgi:hypothetical protein